MVFITLTVYAICNCMLLFVNGQNVTTTVTTPTATVEDVTSAEPTLPVTWNEAYYPDNLIFSEEFESKTLGTLEITNNCYNNFKVYNYDDLDLAPKPSDSNGNGLLVDGDGCFATPILRLFMGSFYLLKMKTLTPSQATVTVTQEVLPYTNNSIAYHAGCWFLAQGVLDHATSRVLFNFTFSISNAANFSFVIDSLRIEGPTIAPPRGHPRRVGWFKYNMELRALAAQLVFPFVAVLGLFIPLWTILCYY